MRKHSDEFKAQVVAEVAGGKSQGEVAREHKLSTGLVSHWVHKSGRATGGSRLRVTEDQKTAALAELAAGGRAKDIAKKYGVSDAALYLWRKGRQESKVTKAMVAVNGAKALNGVNGKSTIANYTSARDAVLYLRKAKAELFMGIRSGRIHDIDPPHLLALLALDSLQNGER